MRSVFRAFILMGAILIFGLSVTSVYGMKAAQSDDVTAGGRLYDKWFAALNVPAPEGNHPIWERQTSNTRSGAETWRCAECHGWDYKGSAGAYAAGSHFTGFPGVITLADDLSAEEIVGHLQGSKDPSHDFSAYLDESSMKQLAAFLKDGLLDADAFIDPVTLRVRDANLKNGEKLYSSVCAACHGTDGKTIVFRSEGVDEYLGTIAARDPYRFLHRTRFGVAGTSMPIGRDMGWSNRDGADVLGYVQANFVTGAEQAQVGNAGAGSASAAPVGEPAGGVAGGILTGIAAALGTLGVSAFFLLGFVALGFVVVRVFRRRK